MSLNSPAEVFSKNISHYTVKLLLLQKRFEAISIFRILAMLLGLATVIVGIRYNLLWPAVMLSFGCMVAFTWFVIKHNRIGQHIEFYTHLRNINNNETECLNGNFSGNYNGAAYHDVRHFYTADLDIFGPASLYQQLCRAATTEGRQRLANYLQSKASHHEILNRQMALKELAPLVEWRQMLQAYALQTHGKIKSQTNFSEREGKAKLVNWLNAKPLITKPWLGSYFLPLLQGFSCICIIACLSGVSLRLLWIPVIFNGIILAQYWKKLKELKEKVSAQANFLKSYASIIEHIENINFSTGKLLAVKSQVTSHQGTASGQIHRLAKLVQRLDASLNPYFAVLANGLFLWDLHYACRLDKWKEQTVDSIALWFDAVYEAEALCSMAAISYINPDWVFPQISEAPFLLQGQEIGHPLLPKKQLISNNIDINGTGQLAIITGSNMSGKSTFLRTLGINAVMALAGLPVCAKTFALSEFQIFTSMRTHDSLEESTSSFYAELKRLEQLLSILSINPPVFYLLDEILKGTNSHDRHNGAKALSKQLISSNASGMISTHDIELGALAQVLPQQIINYSFNSYFQAGKLSFDYKLTPGVCKSFNASELMKQIGIKITESPD